MINVVAGVPCMHGHMGSSHLSLNSRFVGLQSDGFGKREITPSRSLPSINIACQIMGTDELRKEGGALIVPHGSFPRLRI